MSSPRIAQCFACSLCLREQESSEFSKSHSLRETSKFFQSPRAYIEGERSEFSQVPEPRRKLGFFHGLWPYIEVERSEFFQVSESMWRKQLKE